MLYEAQARAEMEVWQMKMQKAPSFTDRLSKKVQTRINRLIPEKSTQCHHRDHQTNGKGRIIRFRLYGSEEA